MMNQIYVFFLLCIALIAGCTNTASEVKPASDEVDQGVVDNSIYRNKFFRLSMNIPEQWTVIDQQGQKELNALGNKIIAGDDKNQRAVIKAAAPQTVNLLSLFKHPMGAPVRYNPNVMCVAERLGIYQAGIKSGKDYLFHAKTMLQSSQLDVSFPKDIYTEQLGGKDFDVLSGQMHIAGMDINQKYYATIIKGYVLGIVVSYENEQQKSEIEKILKSLQFQQ